MKHLLIVFTLLAAMSPQASSPPVPPIDLDAIDPALRKHLVEPPHITCISQDYKGQAETARYLNHCAEPYHITVVFGNIDDVKQLDLAPGEDKSTHLNIIDHTDRHGSSWYVCPKGYSAVDAKGQYFKRPVPVYLCRELGS